jgi:hypothetical protein
VNAELATSSRWVRKPRITKGTPKIPPLLLQKYFASAEYAINQG